MNRAGSLGVRTAAIFYLLLLVVLPILSMGSVAFQEGPASFWREVMRPQALASIKLTVWMAVLATTINVFAGLWIAWTLARREFWGKRVLDSLLDLPLALPAIVAGLVLVLLYGPNGVIGALAEQSGFEILFARPGILIALLFVTLPLVVRTLQPIIAELDPDVEAAAYTLGAPRMMAFLRVTLPALLPALGTGASLALARALGEFGSLILIAGNVPFRTEVAPLYVFGRIEMGEPQAAAAVAMALLAAAVVLLVAVELLQLQIGQRGVRLFRRRQEADGR
jgi:sulfate transport system permease protein